MYIINTIEIGILLVLQTQIANIPIEIARTQNTVLGGALGNSVTKTN